MIRDWRAVFADDKLPFVIIQMHLFGKLETHREPGKDRVPWAERQESQLAVARTVPNVGCAVTVDLGREQSLHPPDKRSISERAALVARKVAYGEDVAAYGPLYKSMKVEQPNRRIHRFVIHAARRPTRATKCLALCRSTVGLLYSGQ